MRSTTGFHFGGRCSSTYYNNIYNNDMITSVNCDLFLYADDSTLLVGGKITAVIQNTLSIELNAIRGWLEENKLSIHLGKTESILIASKIRLASLIMICLFHLWGIQL